MEDLNNDPNFSGKYRWSKRVRVYGVPSHNLVIIARYHGKVTALDGMSLWTLDDANWSGYRNELDDFVTDEERYIESTTKIVDLVDYLEVDPNGKLTFFIQGEHTTTKIDPETGLPIVEYHAGGIDFTSIVDGINQPGVTNINGDKITFKNGTPIIEAINTIDPDAETTLKIKASVIDLDGYVTTQTLAAGFTSSGRIEAKELSSKNLYVDE